MPRRLLLGLALATTFASSVSAQAWPNRPIRFVVPFPAGGGTDLIGREVTQKMTDATRWNIVVDNRPGSGGNIGIDSVAKSPADGYNLVLGQTSNLAINPTLYSKLPYDPAKDLTPISLVASAPLALVVATNSKYRTLADLIAGAKANPGSLNFATSGNGTVAHLAMELFQREAGIKLLHIPYKGAAQGINDVMSERVEVYVSSIPTLIGHIKNGKMRALAVTSLKRVDDLPQTPTIAESGYKDFEAVTWFGVLGPANLPKDITARLNTEINKALQTPALQKQLSEQGADVKGSTPEQFGQLVRDEMARWGKVVKDSGAKLD
ncbi:tripartite tricarboxylate transporter substrate binding protein [Hydrogenophaga sp. 2FB]|uniref:Bug family tripartite tricarboxylate transporter substrate binding protein n=1 Tax=Hydrogenophaga sp. 2FB TaxID=2502187 RepID=UPI00207B9FE5|nr:tripartite tricarboxylate transporter substrate binding protein [Hydrogenophaga sp. 2FB]